MSEHLSIERMNDLLDGLLPSGEAERARAHVDACETCREAFAVLSETVASVRGLPREAVPPAHLWANIEARIERGGTEAGSAAGSAGGATDEATVVAFPRGEIAREQRRFTFSLPQLAAAAAVVAVLSAGTVWTAMSGGVRPGVDDGGVGTPGATASTFEPGAAARAASVGEEGYDRVIADLEALVARGRDLMAPETAETLEQSLAAIDEALADVRRALVDDPASDLLMGMLVNHQTAKVRVLRQAATTIQASS